MSKLLKTKAKVALLHLALSIIIALLLFGFIYTTWYPGGLIHYTGALKIIIIIFFVDITLGPFLTFIVYNEKKKELKRDICIVISLQFFALVYGVHVIGSSRPAYIVFAVDRFEIAYTNQLTDKELGKVTRPAFQERPGLWDRPTWISAELPSDPVELNDLIFESIGGRDLAQTPKYYRPLINAKKKIIEKSKAMNPEQELIFKKIENISEPHSKYVVIPMVGKYEDYSVILDTIDLTIKAVLNISPWPETGSINIENNSALDLTRQNTGLLVGA